MDLIDRDALRIRFMLPDAQIKGLGLETVIAVRDVMEIIKTAPTVEPKRGRWIVERKDWDGALVRCSECGGMDSAQYPYCHECGAKMERGEDG